MSSLTVAMYPSYSRSKYTDILADALEEEEITVQQIPVDPLFGLLKQTLFTDSRPDVLHLHWADANLTHQSTWKAIIKASVFLFQLSILRIMGISIVWTVHNVFQHERQAVQVERIGRHLLLRTLVSQAIVHCDAAKKRLIKEYRLPEKCERKMTSIPHGNFIDNYSSELTAAKARDQFGFDDEVVFCYFGQIRRYKQVPRIISSYKAAFDESDSTRLLVVGKPKSDELKQEVTATVGERRDISTVLKFVPEDNISRYMLASDVLVHAHSDIFASGSVVMGASFSLPNIVPRIGCLPMLVPDEGGLLYDPSTKTGLQSALQEAVNRDLKEMGQKSRKHIAKFDWETITSETHSVYQSTKSSDGLRG